MFNSKNIGSFVFGLLLLACVMPSVVAQVDASAPSTAAVLIGDNAGHPRRRRTHYGDVSVRRTPQAGHLGEQPRLRSLRVGKCLPH